MNVAADLPRDLFMPSDPEVGRLANDIFWKLVCLPDERRERVLSVMGRMVGKEVLLAIWKRLEAVG